MSLLRRVPEFAENLAENVETWRLMTAVGSDTAHTAAIPLFEPFVVGLGLQRHP